MQNWRGIIRLYIHLLHGLSLLHYLRTLLFFSTFLFILCIYRQLWKMWLSYSYGWAQLLRTKRWFGWLLPGSVIYLLIICVHVELYREYFFFIRFECPKIERTPNMCWHKGRTYNAGDKIPSNKVSPCKKCMCNAGINGYVFPN